MAKMTMMLVIFVVALFTITERAMSAEFQVGDEKGWSIPNVRREDRDFYNEWASKHRFKVNDTVRFKYEDDSVLVVTEEEYDKCKASRPIFFSNNEDTLFTLHRSGLFYFISGVAGHCERGQKMIIKVLDVDQQSSPPNRNQTSTTITRTPPPSSTEDRSSGAITASSSLLVVVLALPFLGFQ